MTTKITTEALSATIRSAHEHGWTIGQIAKELADWLNTTANKTLTATEWGDPEACRAAANRLHELAAEIRDKFSVDNDTSRTWQLPPEPGPE